jgi:hypothetical protein
VLPVGTTQLRGQAIPEQDKLPVPAEIVNVQSEVLRFGKGVRQTILPRQLRWEQGDLAGFEPLQCPPSTA